MPITVGHNTGGYLDALGSAYYGLGRRQRYEVDRARRDQLQQADLERDFRREMLERQSEAQKESLAARHGYNVELAELQQEGRKELAEIERDRWLDYAKLRYQPELDLSSGLSKDLQRRLDNGELHYTPKQQREISNIMDRWDEIRRSNRYTPEVKNRIAQQLQRRLQSIQPMRTIVPQSPYPKGQGVGDVWVSRNEEGNSTGVLLSRDDKGKIFKLDAIDPTSALEQASKFATRIDANQNEVIDYELAAKVFDDIMNFRSPLNSIKGDDTPGATGPGSPPGGQIPTIDQGMLGADVAEMLGKIQVPSPPGPMPEAPPESMPVEDYAYGVMTPIPESLSVAPKEKSRTSSPDDSDMEYAYGAYGVVPTKKPKPPKDIAYQPKNITEAMRDIVNNKVDIGSQEFAEYLASLPIEERMKIARIAYEMGVLE